MIGARTRNAHVIRRSHDRPSSARKSHDLEIEAFVNMASQGGANDEITLADNIEAFRR